LGDFKNIEDMRAEATKAKRIPARENGFRLLHLNQRVNAESGFISPTDWNACAGKFDLDSLKGRLCFAGLDLASTSDIAALVLVFPPVNPAVEEHVTEDVILRAGNADPYVIVPYFWVPKDTIDDHGRRDNAPYELWAKQGFLQATPGNVIDYSFIKTQIGNCKAEFNLKALAYDRWGSQQIVNDLCGDFGFTVDAKEFEAGRAPLLVQFGQGFASMNSPTKELLNLVLARKIIHGGQPVLKWMVSNAIVQTDAAGNVKLDKSKSKNKIDGAVATVMGLEIAVRFAEVAGPSIYETINGVRIA
jgi:phage terminase large subunit-like protein